MQGVQGLAGVRRLGQQHPLPYLTGKRSAEPAIKRDDLMREQGW
jgi:hypothetical protein